MDNLKIISAVSIDGAIGNDNDLLWYVPEDFKRYKEKTTGNICIVGLNTYKNLPLKALEKRTTIVVSGDYGDESLFIDAPEEKQDRYSLINKKILGLCVYNRSTINEALTTANEIKKENQEIYIIGGSQLYKSMIDLCNEAEITWINKLYPEANKRFPIDKLFNDFEIYEDTSWVKSKSGLKYKFTNYKRN